jgi:osmotically-inducible protein OsmY
MKTSEQLKQSILNEIKWDARLRSVAIKIGVFVKDGVATLTGEVDTFRRKLAVSHAAFRVSNIRNVVSEINVNLSREEIRTDEEIASVLNESITLNNAVNNEKIKVEVENGWVFLDGLVEWEFQRETAENAVNEVKGVRGITNQILLKSKLFNEGQRSKKTNGLYHHSSNIDSSTTQMAVFGSGITFHSKVSTWTERLEAISHSVRYIDQK